MNRQAQGLTGAGSLLGSLGAGALGSLAGAQGVAQQQFVESARAQGIGPLEGGHIDHYENPLTREKSSKNIRTVRQKLQDWTNGWLSGIELPWRIKNRIDQEEIAKFAKEAIKEIGAVTGMRDYWVEHGPKGARFE